MGTEGNDTTAADAAEALKKEGEVEEEASADAPKTNTTTE